MIDFTERHDPDHGKETWLKRTHGRLLSTFACLFLIGIGRACHGSGGYVGYANVGSGFLPKMDEGEFRLDDQMNPWHLVG